MKTETKDSTNLYTLEKNAEKDQKLLVTIGLNGNHPVFSGHFPGMPILPGVYLLQMVKDSLTRFLPGTYQLKTASVVKFLIPVNPHKNKQLRLEIDHRETNDGLAISAASYLENASVNFKLKGKYTRS